MLGELTTGQTDRLTANRAVAGERRTPAAGTQDFAPKDSAACPNCIGPLALPHAGIAADWLNRDGDDPAQAPNAALDAPKATPGAAKAALDAPNAAPVPLKAALDAPKAAPDAVKDGMLPPLNAALLSAPVAAPNAGPNDGADSGCKPKAGGVPTKPE